MEIDYNEIFGLEAEEQTTEPDTAAEDAPETQEQPAEQTEEQPAEQPAEQPGEQPAEQQETQSREERSRQAMARRLREAEERGARAERERNSALLARMKIDDAETGETVDSIDKLEAYEKKLMQQRLREGRPNEEDIREVARQAAREIAAPPPAPRPAQDPADDPVIQAELAQIRAMDPEMVDINAILNSDIGPKFVGYVNRKMTFLEAYTLAAQDRIARKTAADASARAKAASKDHLKGTKTGAEGDLPVPREEMALFREFMPNATEAEIRRYYNADRKKYGPK